MAFTLTRMSSWSVKNLYSFLWALGPLSQLAKGVNIVWLTGKSAILQACSFWSRTLIGPTWIWQISLDNTFVGGMVNVIQPVSLQCLPLSLGKWVCYQIRKLDNPKIKATATIEVFHMASWNANRWPRFSCKLPSGQIRAENRIVYTTLDFCNKIGR